MTSKKTPSNRKNKREIALDSHNIRMLLIRQALQLKALKRQNENLKHKILLMESANKGVYKFFYKLAYGCEVILNAIRNALGRKQQ